MRLFVDNLTVIDCSVLSSQHGLSGESWICDFVLTGGLDSQSMVMDFGRVKKQIKAAVDEWVDHKLLVPTRAKGLNQFELHNGIVTLTFTDESGQDIRHVSPESALCLIDAEAISAESVQSYLEQHLKALMPPTVESVAVELRHEAVGGPVYHYSHGLKKHDGHCQRIAHGHRSKIEIWQDDWLDASLMQQWASRWPHIYIGTQDDVVASFEHEGRLYWRFAYAAAEGAFLLELAQDRCEIIDTDSTVECIAEYILQQLQMEGAIGRLRVKAYEGVQKGAIVESVTRRL